MIELIQHKDGETPRLWLITASEFLDAAHTLAIEGTENDVQVRQTSPALVLLAYGFELILKASMKIDSGSYEQGHDLSKLWTVARPALTSCLITASREYVERNLSKLGQYKEAALYIEESLGQPNCDFDHNLARLNIWTSKPYQARYPVQGIIKDGVVDIRFMIFVGRKFIALLHNEIS